MKTLISIILLIVLAIPLAGCTIVREHYHGHAHQAVVVTYPRPRPIRPVPPPRPGYRLPNKKYSHPAPFPKGKPGQPKPPQYKSRPGRPNPPQPKDRRKLPRFRFLPF